jgi:dienelactone hydrolase
MIERAVSFGKGGNLAGILTEPRPERSIAGAPAALMWNVGIHHRIGPYRIQVDIARELARRGFASLRFDLSGMGDSEVQQDSRTDQERALEDVRDAMALLERRRSLRSFVPVGFCSSVDSVHALSVAEDRVIGACFIEGYAYRTPGFWLRYPLRVLEAVRWRRRLIRTFPEWIASFVATPDQVLVQGDGQALDGPESIEPVYARLYPSRAQFGRDVRRMVVRDARLLFIYVGGDTDFNHGGQFAEMVGDLPEEAQVEVVYYRDADHAFYRSDDRQRAVRCIGDWMTRTFGAEASAMASRERTPMTLRAAQVAGAGRSRLR